MRRLPILTVSVSVLCVLVQTERSQAFLLSNSRHIAAVAPTIHHKLEPHSQITREQQQQQQRIFLRCHDRQQQKQQATSHDSDAAASSETTTTDQQRRAFVQHGTIVVAGLGGVASSVLLAPPAAASSTPAPLLVPTPRFTSDVSWPLGKVAFSLLPLAGTSTRLATVEQEIVPDTMWTHDQIQGIVNVNVPVRQTVIRLQQSSGGGGLWVHNPVAPTPQLIRMMRQLETRYGPVRHVVLGTVALEHKATFPAFASHFPQATCWIQPGQWSFPVSVPLELYGLVQRGPQRREIPDPASAPSAPLPEWASEIEYEVLGPFQFQSVGGFSETTFYHKATRTMLVTDLVCSLTREPPAILQEDPRALLYHARDYATEVIRDTPDMRRKGWRHMAQFGLVFFPSQIDVVGNVAEAFREANHVPVALRNLGRGAVPGGKLYPWSWKSGDADVPNFEEISQNGKLFCPPILTKLILDREPTRTLAFVDRVATRFRNVQRIIPCHLNNNVRVRGSREFYQAFDPLRSRPEHLVPQRALAEDLALLQQASDLLTRVGVVAPSQVCDGEPARRQGRFAVNAASTTRQR